MGRLTPIFYQTALRMEDGAHHRTVLLRRGKIALVALAVLVAFGVTFTLLSLHSPIAPFLLDHHRVIYLAAFVGVSTIALAAIVGKTPSKKEIEIRLAVKNRVINVRELLTFSKETISLFISQRMLRDGQSFAPTRFNRERALLIAAVITAMVVAALAIYMGTMPTGHQALAWVIHNIKPLGYGLAGLLGLGGIAAGAALLKGELKDYAEGVQRRKQKEIASALEDQQIVLNAPHWESYTIDERHALVRGLLRAKAGVDSRVDMDEVYSILLAQSCVAAARFMGLPLNTALPPTELIAEYHRLAKEELKQVVLEPAPKASDSQLLIQRAREFGWIKPGDYEELEQSCRAIANILGISIGAIGYITRLSINPLLEVAPIDEASSGLSPALLAAVTDETKELLLRKIATLPASQEELSDEGCVE